MRVVKHWHWLPREVVRLDRALSNLVWLKMTLLFAGVWNYMTYKGPFQLKQVYDSMEIIFFAGF